MMRGNFHNIHHGQSSRTKIPFFKRTEPRAIKYMHISLVLDKYSINLLSSILYAQFPDTLLFGLPLNAPISLHSTHVRTCLLAYLMLERKKFHLFLITANAHLFDHARTYVYTHKICSCVQHVSCLAAIWFNSWLFSFRTGNTSRDLLFSSISRKWYVCYRFCCLIVKSKNKCMVWNQAVIFTITWQHHIINSEREECCSGCIFSRGIHNAKVRTQFIFNRSGSPISRV